MKVTLLSCTPDALNLLLRTKNTRLSYADDPATWNEEKKTEHLSYMLNSIRSSFEFIDYVFQVEGVSRAFTHEFVRHRHGSYAQQSMRVTDARKTPVLMPESINDPARRAKWDQAVNVAKGCYGDLIDAGVPIQDARGLLPTAVTTAIIAKFNLRSLSDMARIRLCTRAAGEFQDVMRAMRERVLAVHPWTAEFIEVQCVADGTCAFPRYGKAECPVYSVAMDQTMVKAKAREKFWSLRHYAAPKAQDGKAM
jgi:flavin-dependent thymidylate synthase